MSLSGFNVLQSQYRWPKKKPKVELSEHGWVSKKKQEYIKFHIRHEPFYILELGAWLGQSTRFFLNEYPNSRIVTIDHWKGSPEHKNKERKDYGVLSSLLPRLYKTFLVNCWEMKDRLVTIKATTMEGMKVVQQVGYIPDLIFIDAGHSYECVSQDLIDCYRLSPEAVFVGDDWAWLPPKSQKPPIQQAVYNFNVIHKMVLAILGNSVWSLRSPSHFDFQGKK